MSEAHKLLIVPSVLDRLIDYDRDDADFEETKDEPCGTISTSAYSTEFLTNQIERDLQNLLQTTRTVARPLPPEYSELSSSIYQYGLPDRISFGVNDSDNERLADEVRRAIALFEPRLRFVRVVIEANTTTNCQIAFIISGHVRARPAPKVVHFDATLSTTARSFTVSARSAAAQAESSVDYQLAQTSP